MNNKHSAGSQNTHKLLAALMMAVALVIVAGLTLLLPRPGRVQQNQPVQENAEQANAPREDVVAQNAILYQTLTYTRCEHEIVRRVTAPTELYGKDLPEVQGMYGEWQITEFSPAEIHMEQKPDIFCPDHLVLMPDATGLLCVFQNKYGDALALVSELDIHLNTLPAAVQEELMEGVGFSTEEELEQWLESVES